MEYFARYFEHQSLSYIIADNHVCPFLAWGGCRKVSNLRFFYKRKGDPPFMANRRYRSQFRFSMHKDPVDIFAHVTFGSSGAPTLDSKNSPGIVSVTRNSTGNYTFVFGTNSQLAFDTYNYLLMVKHVFSQSSAPAAPGMWVS